MSKQDVVGEHLERIKADYLKDLKTNQQLEEMKLEKQRICSESSTGHVFKNYLGYCTCVACGYAERRGWWWHFKRWIKHGN